MRDHRLKEANIQRAVCEYLRLQVRPGVFWTHVPNGGKRDARTGAMLKRQGVRPGVPDIYLLYAGRSFFIELKSDNGRLSSAQYQCLREIDDAGGYYCVAYGLDEALDALKVWGLVQ